MSIDLHALPSIIELHPPISNDILQRPDKSTRVMVQAGERHPVAPYRVLPGRKPEILSSRSSLRLANTIYLPSSHATHPEVSGRSSDVLHTSRLEGNKEAEIDMELSHMDHMG